MRSVACWVMADINYWVSCFLRRWVGCFIGQAPGKRNRKKRLNQNKNEQVPTRIRYWKFFGESRLGGSRYRQDCGPRVFSGNRNGHQQPPPRLGGTGSGKLVAGGSTRYRASA